MVATQALEGIKVLDFTRVYFGPSSTQILGDLGADVYKVESVGVGDLSRFFMASEKINGDSYSFLSLNRNKRSICLDLRQPEGKEVIYKLVDTCDVLVQNFRPDVMGRLGFSYDELSKRNPRLIYASASGFGLTGPYSKKPGQDLIGQAISGMGVMTAQPGEGPHPAGAPISDCYGGILLAQGILAALFARERTGEGQEVSTTLMDAMFPAQTEPITQYLTSGDLPRTGISPTHRFYEGLDGKWFAISVAFRSNPLKDLCDAIGLDDLSQDERFETQQKALEVNADALYAILKEHFLTRARDEWLKVLEEADFLVGPVYGYDEVFLDPQVVHNDMVLEFDHPRAGKVRTVNSPVKYSKTPTKLRILPPLLGQHTDEILQELGYTSNQITELRGKKAVG